MGCEICGRSSCTKSFHSLEEQSEFYDRADGIKDRLRSIIERKVDRLGCEEIDGEVYVKLSEVIDAIQSAD